MATATLWSDVAVNMQSAIGAAIAVTAVTNANPGVATSTAHGLTDGAYVLFKDVQGMVELEDVVVRVANSTANDFELEGIDTTNFGTFTAGNVFELTFGTSISTVTGLSSAGGDFAFVDTTTIHDQISKQIPGLASAISYTLDNIWDVSDVGLLAFKAASDIKAERGFLFAFANGQIMVFNSIVGATLIPQGTAQELVTSSTVLTINGFPTYYAS